MIATQVKFVGNLKYVICNHEDLFKGVSISTEWEIIVTNHVVFCFIFINKLLGTMTAYGECPDSWLRLFVSASPAHRGNCFSLLPLYSHKAYYTSIHTVVVV